MVRTKSERWMDFIDGEISKTESKSVTLKEKIELRERRNSPRNIEKLISLENKVRDLSDLREFVVHHLIH